jgi:hypothetical protein
LFPAITAGQILGIVTACGAASLIAAGYAAIRRLRAGPTAAAPADRTGQETWRMPPLALLARPVMSAGRKIGMSALRLYLAVARASRRFLVRVCGIWRLTRESASSWMSGPGC